MASVQARRLASGDTVWRVLYRHEGRQTSDTFPSAQQARRHAKLVEEIGPAAAREHLLSLLQGPEETVLTLREHTAAYLADASGITAGTRSEYARLAGRTFLAHLGDRPVQMLTRDDVRRWVTTQAATPTRYGTVPSAKTIANAHGLLSAVLAGAVEAGLRPDNPSRGVSLPRGERGEMVFLSHGEFARLLDCVDPFFRPFVATLAGTGLRFGELTALRCGDVDLDAPVPVLRVTRAWKKGPGAAKELGAPKTRRAVRTVSLSPEIVDVIRPLLRGPGDLLFTALRGGPIANHTFHTRTWAPAVSAFAGDETEEVWTTSAAGVRRRGRRVVRRGPGKRPRVHDLRHSHASWLIAARVPLPIVQRRLGHEKISTTVDVYGHLADDALSIAAAATSEALSQALPRLELGPA